MARIQSVRQIAKHLLPCGVHTSLLLLGVGLLTELIDGEAAAGVYTRIADDLDPAELVTRYYAYAANEPYLWLTDAIASLTDAVQAGSVMADDDLRRAARYLVDVDIPASAEHGGGELLGPVRVELETLIRGEAPALAYLELDTALEQALMDMLRVLEPGKPLGTMVDGWCGSGVRVIAMAIVLDSLGYDPSTAHWHLRDPDPINIAVAAINCRAAQLPSCSFENAPGIFNKIGHTGALTPAEWQAAGGAFVSESMTERDFVAIKAAADEEYLVNELIAAQQEAYASVHNVLTQALSEQQYIVPAITLTKEK